MATKPARAMECGARRERNGPAARWLLLPGLLGMLTAAAGLPPQINDIDWRTSPLDLNLRGQDGERFRFHCPAGRVESGQVLGSSPYTDGSSICAAAAHAGLIRPASGGLVLIEVRPGQAHYPASLSHGVQSESYEKFWSGSFVVLPAETAAASAGTGAGQRADSARRNTTGEKP